MSIDEKLIEVRRAGFEADFKVRRKSAFPGIDLSQDGKGGYKYGPASNDWLAWNAALDSVVVELPEEDDRGRITHTSAMRAIRAAGVRTK